MKLKSLLIVLLLLMQVTAFAQKQKLTLILDWFINPDHAPIYTALQQGYFKQQGIKLNIIQPSNPNDGPKMVAAGKADIAITYQPGILFQTTQGLPLVRFASLFDQPLACMVALKASGFHSIADLKDKIIGYSGIGGADVILKTMLKYNGLSFSSVHLVNVQFDLVQALLINRVAAFTGGMRNFEPIQIKLAGQQPQLFYPEKNGVPPYDELIFVANKNTMNQAVLQKFVVALKQGVQYLRQHKDQSWTQFAQNHPSLNNTLNRLSWMASIPYFATDPGALDVDKYNKFAQFMYRQGGIPYVPKLSDYAISLN